MENGLAKRSDAELVTRDVGFCAFVQQPVRRIEFSFADDPLKSGSTRHTGRIAIPRNGVEVHPVFQKDFRALRLSGQERIGNRAGTLDIRISSHSPRLESPLQEEIQNRIAVKLDGRLNPSRDDLRRNRTIAGGQLPDDFQITLFNRDAESIARKRLTARS